MRLEELKVEAAQVVAEAKRILKAVGALKDHLKERPAIATLFRGMRAVWIALDRRT